MRTRITDLFQIEHPILLSGMSWISTPELVAAVSNAGGLGILATGVLETEQTRDYVRRTRELTDRPFAANITLYFPGAERNARVLLEERVPILNYALGKGDWIATAAHEYGAKVIATVTTEKHARAAQRDGADALIVTGHEAAGHGGDVTSLVLIPALVDAVSVPVVAAGGFADGRGLVAALSLGADGVAMGTRLMNTRESPVHEDMKRVGVERGVTDSLVTTRVDGLPARVVRSRGVKRLMRRPVNPLTALLSSRQIARMLGLPWGKLVAGILFTGWRRSMAMARMARGFSAFQLGTMNGDLERGVLPLGQVTGLVHDTPTVAEVIKRTVAEAEQVIARLQRAV